MLSLLIAGLMAGAPVMAQTPDPAPPPAATSADGASSEAIVRALYDVISGEQGAPRNWARFRGLFYPGARMIAIHRDPSGHAAARVLTPDQYISLSEPLLQRMGFFEREAHANTERFGDLVFVQSAYESRHAPTDPKPFDTGTNSIHLLFDGTRWWILTVAWS